MKRICSQKTMVEYQNIENIKVSRRYQFDPCFGCQEPIHFLRQSVETPDKRSYIKGLLIRVYIMKLIRHYRKSLLSLDKSGKKSRTICDTTKKGHYLCKVANGRHSETGIDRVVTGAFKVISHVALYHHQEGISRRMPWQIR